MYDSSRRILLLLAVVAAVPQVRGAVPVINNDGLIVNSTVTSTTRFHLVGYADAAYDPRHYNAMSYDGVNLWLIPAETDSVRRVSPTSGQVTGTYSGWPGGEQSIGLDRDSFISSIYANGKVWMIPFTALAVVSVDSTGSMQKFEEFQLGDEKSSKERYLSGGFDGTNMWLVPAEETAELLTMSPVTGDMAVAVKEGAGSQGRWPSSLRLDRRDKTFAGGVCDHNGAVWLAPRNTNAIVKVTTNSQHHVTAFKNWPFTYRDNDAYSGAVFDGQCVWLVPYEMTVLAKIDTSTGVISDGAPGFSPPAGSNGNFYGGLFDGKHVWMIPQDYHAVIMVDTATSVVSAFGDWPLTPITVGRGKYVGAGAFDGTRIFMAPNRGGKLIAATPASRTLSATVTPAAFLNQDGFGGSGAVASNPIDNGRIGLRGYNVALSGTPLFVATVFDAKHRKLWLIPFNTVGIVEMSVDTHATSAVTGYPSQFSFNLNAFAGASIDHYGQLWCVPHYASHLLNVNTATGSVQRNLPGSSFPNFNGTASGQYFCAQAFDGKRLWMIPSIGQATVLHFVVGTGSIVLTSMSTVSGITYGAQPFRGAVFDGSSVWVIPGSASHVLEITGVGGTSKHNGWPTGGVFNVGNTDKFSGGVFDGLTLWMIPSAASHVVKLAVSTGTMQHVPWPSAFVKSTGASYRGGFFDGRYMWMCPLQATFIVRVDTRTGGVYEVRDMPAGLRPWHHGSGAFDGTHGWLAPYVAGAPAVIRVGSESATATLSRNKFTMIRNSDGLGSSIAVRSQPLTNVVMTANTQWPSGYDAAIQSIDSDRKFASGCFDGTRIWLCPFAYTAALLSIDVATGVVEEHVLPAVGFVGGSPHLFFGAVFAESAVWFIPYKAKHVLRVDSTSLAPSMYDGFPTLANPTSRKFSGGALDDRGNLWMATSRATAGTLVSVATSGETMGNMTGRALSMTSTSGGTFTESQFPFSGAQFDGASVWLIPSGCSHLVEVDAATDVMTAHGNWPSSVLIGALAFNGGMFDGISLWLVPFNAGAVIRVDITTKVMVAFENFPNGINANAPGKFSGGFFDGAAVWMVDGSGSGCNDIVRVDVGTGDMTTIDQWPAGFVKLPTEGFVGAAFDGARAWLIPYAASKVIVIGPATATHTESGHATASGTLRATESNAPKPTPSVLTTATASTAPTAAHSARSRTATVAAQATASAHMTSSPSLPPRPTSATATQRTSTATQRTSSSSASEAVPLSATGTASTSEAVSLSATGTARTPTTSRHVSASAQPNSRSDSIAPSASLNEALTASETVSRRGSSITGTQTLPLPIAIDEPIVAEGEQVAAAVIGGVSAVVNPAAALQVTRALAVMAIAECRRDHEARMMFPLSVAPFFGFGARVGHFARGAVVANIAGFALAVCAAVCVGALITKFRGRERVTFAASCRAVRFPGGIAFMVAFVVGGTAMGAVSASKHSPSPGLDGPLAALTALLVVASVAVMVVMVRRATTSGHTVFLDAELAYTKDSETHSRGDVVFPRINSKRYRLWRLLFFGTHAWVPHGDRDDVEAAQSIAHFGFLYMRYRHPLPVARRDGGDGAAPGGGGRRAPAEWFAALGRAAPYFFPIDVTLTSAVSAVAGMIPVACSAVAVTVAVLSFLMLLLGIVLRPQVIPAKNALVIFGDALTFVATAMVAVGVSRSDSPEGREMARSGARLALSAANVALVSAVISVSRFCAMRFWKCRMMHGAARRVENSMAVPLLDLDAGTVADVAAIDVADGVSGNDINLLGAVAGGGNDNGIEAVSVEDLDIGDADSSLDGNGNDSVAAAAPNPAARQPAGVADSLSDDDTFTADGGSDGHDPLLGSPADSFNDSFDDDGGGGTTTPPARMTAVEQQQQLHDGAQLRRDLEEAFDRKRCGAALERITL
jgi:hypothetical protein